MFLPRFFEQITTRTIEKKTHRALTDEQSYARLQAVGIGSFGCTFCRALQ